MLFDDVLDIMERENRYTSTIIPKRALYTVKMHRTARPRYSIKQPLCNLPVKGVSWNFGIFSNSYLSISGPSHHKH